MIFKVTYKPAKFDAPTRENTESLYVEASDIVIARRLVKQNTPYNIELIQELTGNSLKYEQEHADFKLTAFGQTNSED